MSKYLTITEARRQLLDLPDKLKDEPVIITKHGKPVMAALSFEQYESLLETLSIQARSHVCQSATRKYSPSRTRRNYQLGGSKTQAWNLMQRNQNPCRDVPSERLYDSLFLRSK
jgi:prevent-host-death family protein